MAPRRKSKAPAPGPLHWRVRTIYPHRSQALRRWLALDLSASSFFMAFDPEAGLGALLHASRVVRSLPGEGRLVATARRSLANVVDRRRGDGPLPFVFRRRSAWLVPTSTPR